MSCLGWSRWQSLTALVVGELNRLLWREVPAGEVLADAAHLQLDAEFLLNELTHCNATPKAEIHLQLLRSAVNDQALDNVFLKRTEYATITRFASPRLALKLTFLAVVVAIGLITMRPWFAQALTATPPGSTGLCNDGSYTSNETKNGACREPHGRRGLVWGFGSGVDKNRSARSNAYNAAGCDEECDGSDLDHCTDAVCRSPGGRRPGPSLGEQLFQGSSLLGH